MTDRIVNFGDSSSQRGLEPDRGLDPGPDDATADRSSRVALLLQHPLSGYYLLVGATLLLLLLGLIMVLSASSIESVRVFGSPYTLAQRQAFFAILGIIAMFFASRTSVEFWRAFAWPLLLMAFGFLIAVLIIGVEVAGQRNWIEIVGPFRFQPSEIAKLALVVWGAEVLSRPSRRLDTWRGLLVPIAPVAVIMMVLVIAEGDFGNTVMLGAILAGMMFAAGAPLRVFAAFAALGAVAVWVLSLAAPYRMERILSWLDPGSDRLGFGWQVTQGQYALGTGGFWGVGLGASREKWGTLPEAHTDFIFPVVGEELGLVGTLTVLGLFSMLAFAIFRLSRNTDSPFVRYAAAGVGSWIVVQAVVNIGGVLGLLPVAGVTLPLVSYGGSSLIPTLTAIGMLMAFAKREPDARRALRRRSTAQALRRR